MKLNIMTPYCGRIELENVASSNTILMLKEKIQEKNGIPPDQQDLFLKCERLVNEMTLDDYGIKEKCPHLRFTCISPAIQMMESLETMYFANKLSEYDISALKNLLTIIKFDENAKLLDSSYRVVKTEKSDGKTAYHLNSCAWSDPDCREGPDNCGCYHKIKFPDSFFLVERRQYVRMRGNEHAWHEIDHCPLVKAIKGCKPSWWEKGEPCCETTCLDM